MNERRANVTALGAQPTCPNWCTLSADHPFNDADYATVVRTHVRHIAIQGDNHPAEPVELSAVEVASIGTRRVVDRLPTLIWAEANEGMSGPEARQLAAALIDAADAWDEAVRR